MVRPNDIAYFSKNEVFNVNNTFAKSALAAGVVAALSYAQPSMAASLAPVASDVVILGCSVPSAGTTVATVYSVDQVSSQNSTYTISLPTTVATGRSCAGAIKALGTTTTAGITQGNITLGAGVFAAANTETVGAPTVQSIPNTSYAVQVFTFNGQGATGSTYNQGVGFIGCAAAGATGATVYSVDTTNQANASSTVSLNALVGAPCSYALAVAGEGYSYGFGGVNATGVEPAGQAVLNVNSTGYSLNQYTFQ